VLCNSGYCVDTCMEGLTNECVVWRPRFESMTS